MLKLAADNADGVSDIKVHHTTHITHTYSHPHLPTPQTRTYLPPTTMCVSMCLCMSACVCIHIYAKGSVAAIHFTVTNAAKFDVDDTSLVQELQQLGLPKENADHIGKVYREHKEALREVFARESLKVSVLMGVEWRVDHVVASSSSSSYLNTSSNTSLLGDESQAIVQLKMVLDTRPQDSHSSTSLSSTSTSSSTPFSPSVNVVDVDGGRVQEFAMEMTSAKLNVLIHELNKATVLMMSVQN